MSKPLPRLEGGTLHVSRDQFEAILAAIPHDAADPSGASTVAALSAIGLTRAEIATLAFKAVKLAVAEPEPAEAPCPFPGRVLP